MDHYPTPSTDVPPRQQGRARWESWQVALVWVAGIIGACVAVVVSYLGGWIGVAITMECTDRAPDTCPDGSILGFLALGFPALVLVLSLFTALVARQVRWLFTVACVAMVVGPPVNLLVLSALQA